MSPTLTPKNSARKKKGKKTKIESKSNVRIEGSTENDSCSTTRVDPRTVFKPYRNFDPENSPLGPQKVKNKPKIKSNSNVRIKETKKMKVVQLHE